jgi:uncharacterized protein (DUF1786 family)
MLKRLIRVNENIVKNLTFPKVTITIPGSLVDFTMIEGSDCATCAFPQRIGDFGGLVVSMLASGTQDRGFEPGRSRRIFRAKKIRSTPSFGGEVKPSVPCRKFAACKRTL